MRSFRSLYEDRNEDIHASKRCLQKNTVGVKYAHEF